MDAIADALEPVPESPGRSAGVSRAVLEWARRAAALSVRYHGARLHGAEHLPEGPALLVGNHGVYGYETVAFFWLLHRATGRYPVGLAEKGFFRIPLVKTVLPWLGGVKGTRENARRCLERGDLVVCYPGGAREVFKRPSMRYRLRWEKALGFVRLASTLQVPVLPFAGRGCDDVFPLVEDDRWVVRLAADPKYHVPVGLPIPRPVPLRFSIGAPLPPPPAGAPEADLERFREDVAGRVRRLLEESCDA